MIAMEPQLNSPCRARDMEVNDGDVVENGEYHRSSMRPLTVDEILDYIETLKKKSDKQAPNGGICVRESLRDFDKYMANTRGETVTSNMPSLTDSMDDRRFDEEKSFSFDDDASCSRLTCGSLSRMNPLQSDDDNETDNKNNYQKQAMLYGDISSLECDRYSQKQAVISLDSSDSVTTGFSNINPLNSTSYTVCSIQSDDRYKPKRGVSFREEIVSSVVEFEPISQREKEHFFYSPMDMYNFRMEYIVELQEDHRRKMRMESSGTEIWDALQLCSEEFAIRFCI